jgi:hypothetical protein
MSLLHYGIYVHVLVWNVVQMAYLYYIARSVNTHARKQRKRQLIREGSHDTTRILWQPCSTNQNNAPCLSFQTR